MFRLYIIHYTHKNKGFLPGLHLAVHYLIYHTVSYRTFPQMITTAKCLQLEMYTLNYHLLILHISKEQWRSFVVHINYLHFTMAAKCIWTLNSLKQRDNRGPAAIYCT